VPIRCPMARPPPPAARAGVARGACGAGQRAI